MKRDQIIPVRVSFDEKEELKKRAAEEKLGLSAWCRSVLWKTSVGNEKETVSEKKTVPMVSGPKKEEKVSQKVSETKMFEDITLRSIIMKPVPELHNWRKSGNEIQIKLHSGCYSFSLPRKESTHVAGEISGRRVEIDGDFSGYAGIAEVDYEF